MRVTTTNSGADSKGIVRFGRWELEGESYLLLVVGAVCGVGVFIIAHGLGFWGRLVVASLPLAAAIFWIRCFVCGKPPHYAGDFFEGVIAGDNFSVRMEPRLRPPHPLSEREPS